MNEIPKVIDCIVADLQVISDAEAARDREDGAGLTGEGNRSIHAEYRAVYTNDGAVHVHNEHGVAPYVAFDNSGLVCLANINGAADVDGTNQNDADGADFASVVGSALEISCTGNHIMVLWVLFSG